MSKRISILVRHPGAKRALRRNDGNGIAWRFLKVMLLLGAMTLTHIASAADIEHGKEVFERWCAGCHEALPGSGYDPPAGTYTLQQRYQGALPAELEKRTDLQAAYIRTLVRKGINVMPSLRKTEVTDKDLEEVIAYITRNNKH